jgi:nephrocystin-4
MQAGSEGVAHVMRPARDGARALKFSVDGRQEALALHQLDAHGALTLDPVKLLSERHMQLAHYAAHRQLSVDMFDAASSLQIGTASVDLQGLLRQGREHAESTVRAPLFDALEAFTVQQTAAPARTGAMHRDGSAATAVSRGMLQVCHNAGIACTRGCAICELFNGEKQTIQAAG